MALETGANVGGYEIVGPLGTGGMSEVYRARDLKLGREVAIKVLPALLASDEEKLKRFEQEAKLLAALNHPNIAAIHGLENAGDVVYLVLELVPGQTLAERIAKAPLSPNEARSIFLQVASALEAAHEKGIIHRDLKPANVMITHDGNVKLLDFGLGKELPLTPELSKKTQTFAGGADSASLIMGTPAYMSPEQARGQTLARGTDVWSFGVSLFEALTGVRPFERPTLPDTLSAVLNEDPPWTRLPTGASRSLTVLLDRSLRKDPRDRFHDIADVRIELEESEMLDAQEATPSQGVRLPRWVVGLGVGALAALLAWLVLREPRSAGGPFVVRRFVMELPSDAPLSLGGASPLAVSPDGSRLVYTARRGPGTQLYMRTLDQLDTVPIPGTEGGRAPFFSPESNALGFFSGGELKTLALPGGSAVTLAASPELRGASWSNRGVVFSPNQESPLSIVPAEGGAVSELTELGGESDRAHRWPHVMPDGRTALFTSWQGDSFAVGLVDLGSGTTTPLLDDASDARFAPTGHLVFARGGDLFAIAFDARTQRLSGDEALVVPRVAQDMPTGAASYGFSNDGALFYVSSDIEPAGNATVLRVSQSGAAIALGPPRPAAQVPRLSPDGRYLLTTVEEGAGSDIWSLSLERGNLTRLTFEGRNGAAIWSPSSDAITFSSDRGGGIFEIYTKSADGSGAPRRLTETPNPQFPTSWSPDGKFLALTEIHPETGLDILLYDISEETVRPLLVTPYEEAGAMFSPSGAYLAYTSDESGRQEIYVRAFPGPEGRWQVSTNGGSEPVWAPDGRRLFFRSGRRLMAADVPRQASFAASTPRVLFDAPYDSAGNLYANYDISPDGRNFVMIRSSDESVATRVHVVVNWFEELKRRVPVP